MSPTNFIAFKTKLFIYFFHLQVLLFSQEFIEPNGLALPRNSLASEFSRLNYGFSQIQNGFNFSINSGFIINNGHSNVDNNAEFFSSSKNSKILSSRFSYNNSWIFVELEPYVISNSKNFIKEPIEGSLSYNNNHVVNISNKKQKTGFKQSQIIMHYNGFGIGYGLISHWWGPGFHSALSLSSNAASQKTYSIGTFKDLKFGNFSFGSKIIVKPYNNYIDDQIFFSGLKSHISYSSSSTIITAGFHRTYLSGNFNNLNTTTRFNNNWTLIDAAKLVIEPLFGQSKKDLSYTIPGTPGFDAWDEMLTGFVNFNFVDQNLNIYFDIASDDNRGNFSDLRSHWDHTLGYQIGIKKFEKYNNINFFTGIEYLSTKVSNTFNPKFYRGDPNTISYYSKRSYDYFSYKGRRMGAHSGSSSDDFIVMIGFSNKNSMLFMSYNKERHGIKSEIYPELKNEFCINLHQKITNYSNITLTAEYEKISNYSFVKNNNSFSRLFWLSYSFSF